MKSTQWFVAGVLTAGLVGCGGKPTQPGAGGSPAKPPLQEPSATMNPSKAPSSKPAPIILNAEEICKEVAMDSKAASAKYNGKIVEVTGKVDSVRPDAANPTVVLTGISKDGLAYTFSVEPNAANCKKFDGLKSLASGQEIKVRGEYIANLGPRAYDAEFVSVGPSTAIPVTPSELAAALKTPEGLAKFKSKSVVMQGYIRGAEYVDPNIVLRLGETATGTDVVIQAANNAFLDSDEKRQKTLAGYKAGTKVIIIGTASVEAAAVLKSFYILTAPPEGITLPEPKK